MRRPRPGPSQSQRGRKSGGNSKRNALNAYRVDKDDVAKGKADVDDVMDSENEEVKSEDDEDIDSDEAFGESDEEKFDDFKFLGSSTRNGKVFF